MSGRITTGNGDLDDMLGGGILARQVIVVAGPAGAGKTISALQFAYGNLMQGKKCLFISASDDGDAIVKNSLQFGWDFETFIVRGQLSVININLARGEYSLASDMVKDGGLISDYLEKLPKILKSSDADIVIIDSITEFNDLCTSELERRARLLDIRRIIREIGATSIWTAEASKDGHGTKYGIAEYVSDGLILLNRFQPEDFSKFLYIIQIVKMRWIAHSKELRVYSISSDGIELESPLYTTLASGGKIH
jgi:KaiC/GvpD/RAD55 family RecA-like ATPase